MGMVGSHEAVISNMISKARDHLEKAKVAIANLPEETKPIFLPIVFVDKLLDSESGSPKLRFWYHARFENVM